MTAWSTHDPCFQAASTPSGIATETANTIASSINEMVGSMRCAIMWLTGRLVKIEVPRSPCRICHSHSPNRTRNGLSRPSEARMRSTSAGVAWSPAMIAAGSPGAMYSRLKTQNATMSITGTVARMRRVT